MTSSSAPVNDGVDRTGLGLFSDVNESLCKFDIYTFYCDEQ